MYDCQLSTPTYIIGVGGINVVLGVQWLRTHGTIAMNFDVLSCSPNNMVTLLLLIGEQFSQLGDLFSWDGKIT